MTSDRSFTINRSFDAPRDAVFRAWTDPAQLGWFFNDAMPTPGDPVEVDLRVGGAWRQRMVVNEELEYWTGGIYREIDPPARLVLAWGAVGGWPELDPDNLDDAPTATIELIEHGSRTEMAFTFSFPDAWSDAQVDAALASGMREGWTITLRRFVPAVIARSA